MLSAPLIGCEQERLRALKNLNILDTDAEERYDRITRLACDLFQVPTALISLVDSDRQWFKSRQGMGVPETPRDISFCGHVIADDAILIVEDALKDSRFFDNPLVTSAPNIRFYAGYPLHSDDGFRIGTLCLIDDQPRSFTPSDYNRLRDLGQLVEMELSRPWRDPPILTRLQSVFPRLADGLQSFISLFSGRLFAGLVSLVATLLVCGAGYVWDQQQLAAHLEHTKRDTVQKLAIFRGNLETALNTRLHVLHGLSGYVRASSSITDTAFQSFSHELARNIPSLISLQLAPGGIVTYVWPIDRNRAAIGHDLLADPSRRLAAELAIQAQSMWIAGPVDLIQGGRALIARQPIFSPARNGKGSETFWGFGIMLIDFPSLLAEIGLEAQDSDLSYALRGKDALGSEGETFFGDASIFNRDPMTGQIALPAGSWQIAAMPSNGWPRSWPGKYPFTAGALLAAFLTGALIYFLLRLPHSTRRAIAFATAARSRSETRFRDAIEALPDGISIYDRNGALVVYNRNFVTLHNCIRDAIKPGLRYDDFIRAGLQKGQFDFTDSPYGLNKDTFTEFAKRHFTSADESYELKLSNNRWLNIVERRMRDGGTVCFHIDITQQKENERAITEARIRAEKANAAKSTFLATVSHEVRTPLNGVLGLLNTLNEQSALSARDQHYVSTAYDSAQQLLTILNEILDISKMEAGHLELEPSPFNIRDTIKSALALTNPQVTGKGLELRTRISESTNQIVMGDDGRVRQILLNLLSNAVKFTDRGHIEVAADVVNSQDDMAHLTLTVADTGIGFNPEQANRLFEPFTQLDSKTTKKVCGTGLGLAICKRLVNLMNGQISAQGRVRKGARFTVTLPFEVTDSVSASNNSETGITPTPQSLGWPNIRVLMAEDSATNQLVVQAMLKGTGYVLDTVNNGNDALAMLEKLQYQIVLMDIYMPEMDGIEATQRIRQKWASPQLPIIALTANAMQGDRERFIAAGMDDFLAKPVARSALLRTLNKWSMITNQSLTETA